MNGLTDRSLKLDLGFARHNRLKTATASSTTKNKHLINIINTNEKPI
jgi:hypothetical protein